MGCLYESLGVTSLDLRTRINSEENFLIFDPIWLLQLWLNATFESFLDVVVPTDLERQVEGTRLDSLTPEDVDLSNEKDFKKYFFIYMNNAEFVSSMAPFVNQRHGPYWFKRKFPTSSPRNQYEALDIWVAFFKPTILSIRISIRKAGLRLVRYQPSLVVRHFGFNHFSPISFFPMTKKYVWLIPYRRRKTTRCV